MNPIIIIAPIIIILVMVTIIFLVMKKRVSGQNNFINEHPKSVFFIKDKRERSKFKVKINDQSLDSYESQSDIYAIPAEEHTEIVIDKVMRLVSHIIKKQGNNVISPSHFNFEMDEDIKIVIPTSPGKIYGILVTTNTDISNAYTETPDVMGISIIEKIDFPVRENRSVAYNGLIIIYEKLDKRFL